MQLIKKYLNNIKGDKIDKDGKKIFQNDGVSFVAFKEKEGRYRTTVYPNMSIDTGFNVMIITKEELALNCTCNNFKRHGRCEHIVAAMYKICEQFIDVENKKADQEKETLKLFGRYFHLKESNLLEPLSLVLKIKSEDKQFVLALAVIVMGKTYAVSDMRKFIKSINNQEELQFGKNIKLNNYKFSSEDIKVLHFIENIIENSIILTNKLSYRQLIVPEVTLVEILQYFNGKRIDLDGKSLIVNKDFVDYNLKIAMEQEQLVVDFSKLYLKYIPVGNLNRLFIEEDKLIINDENHAFYIEPFIKLQPQTKMKVPASYIPLVMQQIITPLNQTGSIKIAKELNFEQHESDLEIIITVDTKGDSLITYVDFKYGEYTYTYDGLAKFTNKVFVKRDYDQEFNVLKYLFDIEHTKIASVTDKVGYIEYEYEYAKFDLLYEILPQLKQYATINLSDEVKNMQVNFDEEPIELNLKSTKKINYFAFDFNFDKLNHREIRKIIREANSDQKYFVNKQKQFIDLTDKKIINQLSVIDQIKTYEAKNKTVPLYQALYWHQLSNELFPRYNVDKIISKTIEQLNSPVTINNLDKFNGELRDYQLQGVEFLKRLHNSGFSGILADEMGLGKTIQVIAFLVEMKITNSLIVVPKALILNWEREIKKFAPHLKVNVINGIKDKRIDQITDASNYDITISSYSMVRQDIDFHKDNTYEYVIIDEAQYIKNPNAQNTQSLKMLNVNHRLALSGTPIENNVMELWSIFDFLMPGYLLTKSEFNNYFYKEIKLENKERLLQLKKQVDPFILKRNKSAVLKELPAKQEIPMYTELTEEQATLYASYVKAYQEQIENEDFSGNKIQILSMLTRLRQLAIHPQMFVKDYTGESAKMEVIKELVSELIANNQKVLIFSQFTSMLVLIQKELRKMKVKNLYLDGKTSAHERQDLIDEFNGSDTEVFLISLKAGGYGLNLTSASAVIHVDPWWNKSVERQAEDRVHRIGQKQNVSVYKIITTNTIEEKIYELQNQKDDLIETILDEQKTNINQMNKEQLVDLFAVRKE